MCVLAALLAVSVVTIRHPEVSVMCELTWDVEC